MQITDHFSLLEFTVSATAMARGIDNTPGPSELCQLGVLAAMLERVRALLGGAPMGISSGYRTLALNSAVGGVPDSAHRFGRACDFTAPAFGDPLSICLMLEGRMAELGIDQLIHEHASLSEWVHIGRAEPGTAPRKMALTADDNGIRNGFG